ncbi:tRNA lysidine(34) synthetase TilS [Shewanella eurypsychrophilus]|uniref:tRNA(Ile)-lysidine synthase n=1 Tax=Shewanella eurypsychrophilus TaxID=2593656 RepID=A0ABX6V8B3_9GAMM|nr:MULTISPECIES: tRNA lysidine(34) synthetase TilS [Shewanella]QFU23665.1 tRNA lysidine(34) synthetase TilS [Shewanella sp. YLB-09]QPG58887.1 tRNA lysidine(34) synthetase TilS [Shewanella eurypsychrophilus]
MVSKLSVSTQSAVADFSTSSLLSDLVLQADVEPGAKLVLAYSGGVDSEVLAQGLAQFAKEHTQFRYLLLHVHHGLSDSADQWVEHCTIQASKYQLPLCIKHVKVNTGPRKSIEAEARHARYAAIQSQMEAGDVLLTAHHLDDQLETVLLALKRGLGPKGLSAMGGIQLFEQDKQLLRPLLSISREQIESKASRLGLVHITDESNCDTRYDRNFLRLDIIPRLKARWSSIAITASRSASLCAQQQAVIDAEVSKRLPDYLPLTDSEVCSLDLALLAKQDSNWQALLFRGFVEKRGFAPPSQAQLTQALSQLLLAKADARVELRFGDLLIRRYQGRVFLSSIAADKRKNILHKVFAVENNTLLSPASFSIEISSTYCLRLQSKTAGERLRLPNKGEQVSVRFGVKGSIRCQPNGRSKGRELKKLWQEYMIPTWERDKVPLVFYNERLICALGYWVETGYLCVSDELGLLFSQHKK